MYFFGLGLEEDAIEHASPGTGNSTWTASWVHGS
jgi:hypothetical protein